MADLSARRPLKSRDSKVFIQLAARLTRIGVSPNAISFLSIVCGLGSGAAYLATSHSEGWVQRGCWLGAALCIQARLLANLLDGMVAVEGGKGGPTGGLWNEAPDRLADVLIFIGAGYAAGGNVTLGWAAALCAVLVAYIRALGASLGAGQIFLGPQAKQQRMALLAGVSLLSAAIPVMPTSIGLRPAPWLFSALIFVILGCAITVFLRLRRIRVYLRTQVRP